MESHLSSRDIPRRARTADARFVEMLPVFGRFARRRGKIAVTMLLIGNVATLLGSLNAINKAVSDIIGFRPLEYLYRNMRILVMFLFVIGYAFAFYWLYKKFISQIGGFKRPVYSTLLVLATAGILTLNIFALPAGPKADSMVKKYLPKWSERIFASQAENGGFRLQAVNPQVGTQVWTTAQCLKALLTSQNDPEKHIPAIRSAFKYVEDARRSDPEDGWGLFESHAQTLTEVASWVTLAYIASIESRAAIWSDSELPEILRRIRRDLEHIASRQEAGGWRPIQAQAPAGYGPYTRTYSTAMALWSLVEARRSPAVYREVGDRYDANIRNGIGWLLDKYDRDLGWLPNPNRSQQKEAYEGLTAQVLFVLSRAEKDFGFVETDTRYVNAEKSFVQNKNLGNRLQCKVDRIHDSDQSFPPTEYVAEGSTLLWFPWSFLELTHLSTDSSLSRDDQKAAAQLRQDILRSNIDELDKYIDSEFMYVLAENLFSLSANPDKDH